MLLTEGGILPDENDLGLSVEADLEMSHCREGIIKGFEKFSETSQFQRFTNAVWNTDQHDFPPIVFFGVALGSQQSTKPRAGHIFQPCHVDNQFILPTLIRTFKRLC